MKNLIFFGMMVLLCSCSKDKTDFQSDLLTKQRESLPTAADLLELITTPTDGYVVLGRMGSISKKLNQEDDVQLVAEGIKKNGDWGNFGTLTIGNYIVEAQTPSANTYYQHIGVGSVSEIFGTNVSVQLEGNNELPGFGTTVNTVELMNVSSPQWASNLSMGSGQDIVWNADNENDKGVGILIEYDRYDIGNSQLESNSNVERFIHTEDDGLYTLTSEDLSGIPTNAHAKITIARGGFEIVPMADNYKFGVLNFSSEVIAFKRN